MQTGYIVYTEPSHKRSGCAVNFFVREIFQDTPFGKSHVFRHDMPLIIPTFELKQEEALELVKFLREKEEFNGIDFKTHAHDDSRVVVWAYIPDKSILYGKSPVVLPKPFLPRDRVSPSQQARFFYPPYTMVRIENEQVVLPAKTEKWPVSLETIVADKKCALDIEVVDWDTPRERITNAVLNFGIGQGQRGYIVTTFSPDFNQFRGYEIISVGNLPLEDRTDAIKKHVARIIQREDPVILYGFNIKFDQSRLRDLGRGEYLPGVGDTRPVFKSVKGIGNMITKGRFTIDLLPYLISYLDVFEDNRLETHARAAGFPFSKSESYESLAMRTKEGEQGSKECMERVLGYVVEDGNITFDFGENHVRKILGKSQFCGRDTSVVCTSSGRGVMGEYWQREYFLTKNTARDRYVPVKYRPNKFDIWKYQSDLLELDEQDGLFRDVSIVFPKLFIKILWDTMLRGKTAGLRYMTPEEKLDSYKTLDEYLSEGVRTFLKYCRDSEKEPRKYWVLDRALREEFGVGINTLRVKQNEFVSALNAALKSAGVINHSRRFLYVQNPDEIVRRDLGFVFGRGNCLCAGDKIVSVIDWNGKQELIYQGFDISRGRKSQFDIRFMREFLKRRLNLEEESALIAWVGEEVNRLLSGRVERESLIFPRYYDEGGVGGRIGPGYGFVSGSEVPLSMGEFLSSSAEPDYQIYLDNLVRIFKKLLVVGIQNTEGILKPFQIR